MKPLPVVAIVGRPNVGKSTLFNRLTGTRRAVVDDTPGVTRDRLYGRAEAFGKPYVLIDTGGIDAAFGDDLSAAARAQAQLAIEEAAIVVFLLDGRTGISQVDHELADRLRHCEKPVLLVANKLESTKNASWEEAWDLRLGEALPISALHGTQVGDLIEQICHLLPDDLPAAFPDEDEEEVEDDVIRIAVVGRPNVGKSSLVNAILGEERVIVSDIPGTTRDAIDTPFERGGQAFELVDTAGIRRKSKVDEALEYYCVLRALEAMERCQVAVLVVEASHGLTHQDRRIADLIHEAGRGMIIALNKWDRLLQHLTDREAYPLELPEDLERRLFRTTPRTAVRDYANAMREMMPFCAYAPVIATVATVGEGVGKVLAECQLVSEHHAMRIPTGELNNMVREAVDKNPPTRRGQRLKVLYATQARVRPPTFVFFVNDPELVHFSFERYLQNALRSAYNFEGTPVRMVWRARREEEGRPSRKPKKRTGR